MLKKVEHMKKKIFYFLIILFSVIGCQQQEVINTHGIAYLENREKLLTINESNKNDVIQIFGQPATKGMNDDNMWIYIERTRTRGKLLKLGRSYLKKNNVLILEFTKLGILSKKEFYDKEKMNKIKFSKSVTENDLKRENFIYSFLTSVRQKMQVRRKGN